MRDGEQVAPLGDHVGAHVVIVDDEPANLVLLERVLRQAGLEQVHAVGDPREAVRRCLDVGADLMLLDLQMPHLDGFAVLDRLQAELPATSFLPVVVLTSDATTETRDRALAAGATDFLTKPFDHAEVTLRVRNLLETRALYAAVQRHNTELQAELEARAEDERRATAERQEVIDRIDALLASDGIEMVFQPIADLRTGEVLGVEALARFDHEPRRPPNEWFDEAAAVGRGSELEMAAVAAALAQLEHVPADEFLSINISPSTAIDPDFAPMLEDVPPGRLVLELTEHVPVGDYGPLMTTLDALRARGVRIAVDDAGAGYSGLQHVLSLHPDILKLDIALTSGIDADPARRALSTALVAFAREIEAVIIAEGIETREELATLRSLEVPWGQGYHLARPGAVGLAATTVIHLDDPA
jgi:EAL domain-containing protein (putative c-di-GMP-specific phosphodiesterase class I)